MDLWNSLTGMMEVELTSAETEKALEAVIGKGISIFRVQRTGDLTVKFIIRRCDHGALAALSEKRGETLRVCRNIGMFWTGRRLIHRPVLLLGTLFLLILILFLPSRVLFVQVEGNDAVPTKRILAAAEACGIRFGASRRQVRSEKVKNALLLEVPELQWAGVNTSGCIATISVRERPESQKAAEDPAVVSSIVAARDGQILSGTVIRGNGLFQVGDVVKAGQVLISGYTDCGICIQATCAEGEIYAQTNHTLEAVLPSAWTDREEKQETSYGFSLLLGKKRINLWKDSGIWDSSCGRMYEEYYVRLPGGFQLPIALCVDTVTTWDTRTVSLQQSVAQDALKEFAEAYLKEQMIAGSIQERSEVVAVRDGCYRLKGKYVCQEMIGRVRQEQIGETNGKAS